MSTYHTGVFKVLEELREAIDPKAYKMKSMDEAATKLTALHDAEIERVIGEAKMGWANEFIKEIATPGDDDRGVDWCKGWNAYRNKAIAAKAKLKKNQRKRALLGRGLDCDSEKPAPGEQVSGNQADTLLLAFVKNFAFQDDEGNWWGMDTNLGKCEEAFSKAKQAIMEVHNEQNQ